VRGAFYSAASRLALSRGRAVARRRPTTPSRCGEGLERAIEAIDREIVQAEERAREAAEEAKASRPRSGAQEGDSGKLDALA